MIPLPAPPARVLIVRLSALGDLVFCSALLAGLRRAWPRAHLAWLVGAPLAGLLRDDPRLDEVIALPLDAPLAALRQVRGLSRFDLVIDAQGLLKTRALARLVPATQRVGFASREPGAALLDRCVEKGGDIADIASEYRFLAQVLTGENDPGPPRFELAAERQRAADPLLREPQLAPGFVALCPYTTRPQKHWMEDYWPRLAQMLAARGLRCAVLGGPAERPAAQRLLSAMPEGSVNLAGLTPLHLLPPVLAQAGLVIGVDTGLTHLGVALQRPTLALFGSTCPYTRGARSPLRVLYDGLPCAPCKRRPTCGGRYDCLRAITPERVAGAAFALLETA